MSRSICGITRAAIAAPPADPKPQQPDTKPGNYYVTVRKECGDFRCLAGPFRDDHAGALAMVDRARELACQVDHWACFYAFGTARLEYSYSRPGLLNARLGLPS